MKDVGLVLEGGAMRGIYTAGVLDFFLKENLHFPYVIGVSAGACQTFSYIANQKGRNKKTTLKYIHDSRYLSYKNLIEKGSMFGLDFVFGEISKTLMPFDYDAFEKSNQEFAIGATNCVTGEIEYFYKSQNSVEDMFVACTASSSMPLVSREVIIDGKAFLDGGVANPIPIKKAIEDGYEKNVIVLTRNKGYRKKPVHGTLRIARKKYRNYRGLLKAMENRYKVYNETIDYIEKLEKEGKAFVIRPTKPVVVKRMEKDRNKLFLFYKEGYLDAKRCYEEMMKWIEDK